MALREYLDSYIPVNSQEENDLKVMKDFYSTYKNNSLQEVLGEDLINNVLKKLHLKK